MEVKEQLQTQLIYKNLNDKREDLSDLIRGQIKMLDDLIKLPNILKDSKTASEVVEQMLKLSNPSMNQKESK